MTTNYAFENLLRTPYELLVALVGFGFGEICITHHEWLFLTRSAGEFVAMPFFALATWRLWQGLKVFFYRKQLLKLKPFEESIAELPRLEKNIYLGRGFKWLPQHRQRLSFLSSPHNQRFLEKSAFYNWLQTKAKKNPKSLAHFLTTIPFLPFCPLPPIGGKAWLHGVGAAQETPIYLKAESRKGNTIVFGETGVGKTFLEMLMATQDILQGHSVLIIDLKGDLNLALNIYLACARAGRLNDFSILHAGIPELSAKYNSLSNYINVSEVATRVTSSIRAEGEGKQFQDFAWKFLNITATALEELGEPITYQSLAFFISRPKQLLLNYCDKIWAQKDPHYQHGMREIQKRFDKLNASENRVRKLGREEAALAYLAEYVENQISAGKQKSLQETTLLDLYYAAQMDDEFYEKITANLGPIFDKINKTSAGEIFSWEENFGLPVINLEGVIKRKQVVYMCLDAQSNKTMAEAVGQALIADLVSLCGRLYKETPNPDNLLFLHVDEFSEIVRDEFITLLNKARGAGVRVTTYTQTVNDLGAAFSANRDKAKMLLGNFSNLIMMRVGNLDTAKVFTDCLEEIRTRSAVPSTMTNDRPSGANGELFTTYNTDVVHEKPDKIILDNDLFSLPKGQAFMLTDGGELYKIRVPLLKSNCNLPETFAALMSEVNLCQT